MIFPYESRSNLSEIFNLLSQTRIPLRRPQTDSWISSQKEEEETASVQLKHHKSRMYLPLTKSVQYLTTASKDRVQLIYKKPLKLQTMHGQRKERAKASVATESTNPNPQGKLKVYLWSTIASTVESDNRKQKHRI